MNQIDERRAEINKYFNPALTPLIEHTSEKSPSGNYLLVVDTYKVNDPTRNWYIAKAQIFDLQTNTSIFEVKRDDDIFFRCWIESEGIEYLVCSEDMEGQTVIDLTQRMVESYYSDEDPFIWMEFYPSPNKDKLAIIGCYWACPYEVIIYDFNEPMSLPLKRIKEVRLPENSWEFEKWLDDDTFSLRDKNGHTEIYGITNS